MPNLSVLLPVRNGERHLRKAIRSTLAALPADSELVVLDDASTDSTPSILESVSDHRLVVHRTQASLGVANGLNYLASQTDSRYVARMDADDISLPWRFRHQSKALGDCDVLFGAVIFVNENGVVSRPDLPGFIGPESIPLHLMLASFLCHPTMFALRASLPEGPYRSVPAEDYDLWLTLVGTGKRLKRDPAPVILYRQHQTQTSKSDAWMRWLADEAAVAQTRTAFEEASRFIGLEPPAGILEFILSGRIDPRSGRASAIEDFMEEIALHATRVPLLQRLPIQARLASARRRLQHAST